MKQKLVSILLVLCMVVALVPAIALTSAAANGVVLERAITLATARLAAAQGGGPSPT